MNAIQWSELDPSRGQLGSRARGEEKMLMFSLQDFKSELEGYKLWDFPPPCTHRKLTGLRWQRKKVGRN